MNRPTCLIVLALLFAACGEKVTPADPEPQPSGIDVSLTNPRASEAARKVYAFLREQSGQKMLSGVQAGGTANNNDNVDAVFAKTGRHPALAGYDFIFLQYSPTPASWEWKVDYGDISAAREQWRANGLVSYMWHWNVPTDKAAWDKGRQGDFSGYGFYSDKTAFDIGRALIKGTWENDFILQDIEKVAGYLKRLQQEGIPVLWRPLHEAAGNYDRYGPGGAWFWWGRGGADACKRLWKLLRDKLEGEYGLGLDPGRHAGRGEPVCRLVPGQRPGGYRGRGHLCRRHGRQGAAVQGGGRPLGRAQADRRQRMRQHSRPRQVLRGRPVLELVHGLEPRPARL